MTQALISGFVLRTSFVIRASDFFQRPLKLFLAQVLFWNALIEVRIQDVVLIQVDLAPRYLFDAIEHLLALPPLGHRVEIHAEDNSQDPGRAFVHLPLAAVDSGQRSRKLGRPRPLLLASSIVKLRVVSIDKLSSRCFTESRVEFLVTNAGMTTCADS